MPPEDENLEGWEEGYETWLDELNSLLRCPTCNSLDDLPNQDCPDCREDD